MYYYSYVEKELSFCEEDLDIKDNDYNNFNTF